MDNEILYKFVKCQSSEQENRQIVAWLEADPEHQRELDKIQLRLETIALCAPMIDEIADHRDNRSKIHLRRIISYAASVAAVILICGLFYANKWNQYSQWSDQMTSLTVPAGQRVSITLQDSTVVWLNSGTTIEYPSVFFGRKRKVRLSGEALFEVKHDSKRPFIVETFACDVEVLGTKFNVEANKASGEFSTALLSGSVKIVNHLCGNEQIVMKQDDVVSLVDGKLRLSHIENSDDYRWCEGIISIREGSFTDLMSKFERTFDVKIVVERESMPQVMCSYGNIRISDGVDHALRILQLACDFSYKHDLEHNTIIIK